MEMVDGAGGAVVDLLLRALRLREHHCARDGDVCAVSDRDPGCGSACIPRGVVAGVFLEPRRIADALRNHPRANLLRRRLHNATNVVDARIDNVGCDDRYLERRRFHVVEDTRTLVVQPQKAQKKKHKKALRKTPFCETMFSTDSEEIYVEINSPSFTKLLQTHIYNTLHTSAACRKTLPYEHLDSCSQ